MLVRTSSLFLNSLRNVGLLARQQRTFAIGRNLHSGHKPPHADDKQVAWEPFKKRKHDNDNAQRDRPTGDWPQDASTNAPDPVIGHGYARPGGGRQGRVIFSGIQPTGIPHLGNYLGALRQWKQYHQQSMNLDIVGGQYTEQFFSIVDLHALTSAIPRQQRSLLRKESFASLLAMGLTNQSTTAVFFQSDVS